MSNLKQKSTNRYQNPELFEQLAIEYAVGSLHGRARKRFEVLMDTHFYLRAVVDAYENKFAHLVELLPDEKPSDQVWNNIEAHIQSSSGATSNAEKQAWWKAGFFKKSFGFVAMALAISAVLLLNPMTFSPAAYTAVLESVNNVPMAVTKISHSDMKLSIDFMKEVEVADDMELTLWCHPKKGGKPMKMGTVSKTGKTMIEISKKEWEELKNVGILTLSAEHKNTDAEKPGGEVILKGQLSSS